MPALAQLVAGLLLATSTTPATAVDVVTRLDRTTWTGWEDVTLPVSGTTDPGADVLVQTSVDGGATWQVLARTTAGAEGRFSVPLTWAEPRRLLVRATSGTDAPPVASVQLADRVLGASFSRDRSRAGVDTVSVRARITGPLRPTAQVLVSRNRGRLRLLGRLPAAADGTYAMRWKPSRPGTYRLRVVAPGAHPRRRSSGRGSSPTGWTSRTRSGHVSTPR